MGRLCRGGQLHRANIGSLTTARRSSMRLILRLASEFKVYSGIIWGETQSIISVANFLNRYAPLNISFHALKFLKRFLLTNQSVSEKHNESPRITSTDSKPQPFLKKRRVIRKEIIKRGIIFSLCKGDQRGEKGINNSKYNVRPWSTTEVKAIAFISELMIDIWSIDSFCVIKCVCRQNVYWPFTRCASRIE